MAASPTSHATSHWTSRASCADWCSGGSRTRCAHQLSNERCSSVRYQRRSGISGRFPNGCQGLLSGVFVAWSIYLIVTEEIHWRIHMNGWLPPGLGFARAYHLSHHDVPNSRYNVFLPLFDFLFESTRPRKSRVAV